MKKLLKKQKSYNQNINAINKYSYLEEFQSAINNSNKLFKSDIQFKYKNTTYNTEENLKKFQIIMSEYVQDKDISYQQIVGNCSPFHYFMKSVIEELYNCKCHITIGYVSFTNKDYFKFDLIDVKKAISTKQLLTSHHTWLTLDNYEVLDMVFPTSYGMINNDDELIGQVIQKSLNDSKGMIFHPMLVGDDFFKQCGFDLDFYSSLMYKK